MNYIIPPCPRCDAEMQETDECLKCMDCGEEQPFAYRVNLEDEQPEPTETVDTLKEHYTDHTTKLLNKIYGEEGQGK